MSTTLIERLATIPAVGNDYRPYSLSPDGSLLAFQWYREGDWQIYLMPADAGGEPRRVAEIDDPCWCPLFSPDGRYLYFARDDRGSECFDYYRCDLTTGALENLLPDTPGFSPLADFSLSPDGQTIALSVQRGESYSAALMPAAGAPGATGLRHLTDHYYNDLSPVWSPDGNRIAFMTDTHGQDCAVAVCDVRDGSLVFVGGGPEFLAGAPAWSPDGRTIAFHGGPSDHPAIGLCTVADGRISWVWEGDHDAHHPVWSPDGSSLAFLTDEDAETRLWLLDLAGGKARDMSVGRGNHYAPGFFRDGRALICCLSAPDHPADLFRVDLADGEATQLTRSLPQDLRGFAFIGGEPVTYTSLDHLAEVPALLVRPRDPNGAAVVMIHGGPTWHHSNEWDPMRQAFVQAGLTVLHPNYRGSDGYGRRWQLANRWLMGQGEVLDCAGAHRYLVGLGCDADRIAVTGRSWGGFMTMALLTQFPELFACGVAGVPFFDFIQSQIDEAVREDLRWWDRENTGDIVKDRAKLEYYSPINHLDRVRAPLLMLGGALDPRCPPHQIGEVAERLRSRKMVCETVVYPDEGHEISGFANRLDYDKRTVEFILRHTGVA